MSCVFKVNAKNTLVCYITPVGISESFRAIDLVTKVMLIDQYLFFCLVGSIVLKATAAHEVLFRFPGGVKCCWVFPLEIHDSSHEVFAINRYKLLPPISRDIDYIPCNRLNYKNTA